MRIQHWMRRAPWLLALAIVFTLACGDDDNGTNPDGDGNGGGSITFPLKVGNGWTYSVTETGTGKSAPAYNRTDTIIGTATIDGQPYYALEASDDAGGDPDTSFVRQSAQQLLLHLNVDVSELPSSMGEAIANSLPWEAADFAANSGSTWTILDYSEQFPSDGFSVEIHYSGKSLGRIDNVQVPAGNYDDVYKGQLIQTMTLTFLPPLTGTSSSTTTQTLYVKDGVGIVKDETELRVQMTGQAEDVSTTTSVLTAFDVQ
ncbi:MAG: hypothetical protein ACE15D_06860 [Candidatus Eisenbacteria bacterium]|nr:hypothetical protein [Candidatus Eisenbacteria bacterium]